MQNPAKAFLVCALIAGPALAGEPAALILDVSGSVEPEVGLYDEVSEGTVLSLATDAKLTISHYGACEEVALTGGTVTVNPDKLAIEGGEVVSREPVECPDQVVASAADLINMAVTLRAAKKQAPGMAPTPEFILPGAWGKQFEKLDLYGNAGLVTTVPVVGGRASWPAEAPALNVGETYVVVANGTGAQQYAARIEVTADPQGITIIKGR